MNDSTTLYAYAAELLEAANSALATTTAGAISRAFVSPTLPALDCCPALTVDVRGLQFEFTQPTNPVPATGHRSGIPQGVLYLAVLAITVVRCAPVVKENTLPTTTEMDASARATTADVWAIWNGLQTLKREGRLFEGKCPAMYIDPPVPLEASGGCVGWVITVRPAIGGYAPAIPS